MSHHEQNPNREIRKASTKLRKTLAENVVRFRRETGISQEELADRCGLHRTYIGSIERGERNATLSTLEAIANALGVDVSELLTNKEI